MVLVDPDLGRALSGGYHRAPATTTPGPPPWPSPAAIRTAVISALTLAPAPLTTTQLGERLGLDSRGRANHLRPALVTLAGRGVVECIPHPRGRTRACTWRLTATEPTKENPC